MRPISITASDPLPKPRGKHRRINFLFSLFISLSLLFTGADLVFITFSPLDRLGIPYPHFLRFAHFLIAGMVIVAWVLFRRAEVAMGVVVFLALGTTAAITHWAQAQLAKIPMTKWMEPPDLKAAEQRLGFRVTETAGKDGAFLLVARGNERAATDEVRRLGLYRP